MEAPASSEMVLTDQSTRRHILEYRSSQEPQNVAVAKVRGPCGQVTGDHYLADRSFDFELFYW